MSPESFHTSIDQESSALAQDILVNRMRRSESNQTGEIDRGTELTAILTHALHDESPSYSLQTVARALAVSGASPDLDALHVVPLVIETEDSAPDEILALLSSLGNAKETVMSTQESFERLRHDLTSTNDLAGRKVFLRLRRLFRLYIGAIPRLQLRKMSASKALEPLFADIVPTVELAGGYLKKGETEIIVQLTCTLVTFTTSWATQQGNEVDVATVKSLCRAIFVASVAIAESIWTYLTQEKFEACNPRLFQRVPQNKTSQNEVLLQECLNTALMLSYTIDDLLKERTMGSLVLLSMFLSRPTLPVPPLNSVIETIFPALIATLQSNACICACLNILLHVLYPSEHSTPVSTEPDILAPLISSLAPLASTSPDPSVRLIAFRILGTLLAHAPPLEHMALLLDLMSETPFPSLRVAAVGLLKEAVLEALDSKVGPNPFASPDMFRTFGYIVFRPDPADCFAKPATNASLQAFFETQEPRRLVECLGFYYVLLMRDGNNVTGVRETSQIKSVNREFLEPLKGALRAWTILEDFRLIDEHAGMALAALETSLERIDEAYKKLNIKVP